MSMNTNIPVSRLEFKGSFDGVGGVPNNNIQKGDCFTISNNFSVGSNDYLIGDIIVAMINNPGQNTNNWSRIEPHSGYIRTDEDIINEAISKYKFDILTNNEIDSMLYNYGLLF